MNTKKSTIKTYSRLELFLRSFIFSLVLDSSCVLYSLICLLAAPLPLSLRFRITQLWLVAAIRWCRFMCHIDYKIEGEHHLRAVKNAILMIKHQSAWETYYFQGHFHEIAMIAKQELLWIPFFGWTLALLKPIAINRKKTKSAMQQINQQGTAYLKAGRWLAIFPEGTRVAVGHVGHYKIGGARLSVESGYPVIPVAHNAGHCWPRRKFLKQPGLIRVVYGPPIYPEGKTAEEILALSKAWIEATMLELS